MFNSVLSESGLIIIYISTHHLDYVTHYRDTGTIDSSTNLVFSSHSFNSIGKRILPLDLLDQ